MVVFWSDEVDAILGGDLTTAVAYQTPAGGAVVTAVAPIGLRDRDTGTVAFTTSLGFAKKVELHPPTSAGRPCLPRPQVRLCQQPPFRARAGSGPDRRAA